MKHPASSLLDYCRDFGKAMRDIYWANNKLVCEILQILLLSCSRARIGSFLYCKLNPISVIPMDKRNIAKMREWASEHEQCVRQLTVRQQTIKFSAGTFPMSQPMGYKHATRSSQQQWGRRSHRKRGRGSHRRVWQKPETALEKSLAPEVSMALTLIPIYLLPQLSEDEDMKSDVVVSSTLKTRNGRQIKAVVSLNL